MSGGKEAQLAFHYQNTISVLKILKGLNEGKLISAMVEQKIYDSEKEIDIILGFLDNRFEYHEVKSGEGFTNDGAQIKGCLNALFEHYKSRPAGEQSKYFVIINPDFLPPVAAFTADIRRFSRNKTTTKSFKSYCVIWGIKNNETTAFHTFIKLLSLDHEMNLGRLKIEALAMIGNITSGFFMNADHALCKEDLLNRLINLILVSVENNAGVINLQEFADAIVDWSARNAIAYETGLRHDVRTILEAKKIEIATKLNAKFISIAIPSPSPSPSESISEEQL